MGPLTPVLTRYHTKSRIISMVSLLVWLLRIFAFQGKRSFFRLLVLLFWVGGLNPSPGDRDYNKDSYHQWIFRLLVGRGSIQSPNWQLFFHLTSGKLK